MAGPDMIVPLGFFAMVTAIAIGVPYARALARRDNPALPATAGGGFDRG